MNQPAQQQEPPGVQSLMSPVPDCGEESYVGAGRLTGKVAVITGGDSGIGRAVAIAYAREGADVVISYLSEHDDAKDTAQWVERAGRKAQGTKRGASPRGLTRGRRRRRKSQSPATSRKRRNPRKPKDPKRKRRLRETRRNLNSLRRLPGRV